MICYRDFCGHHVPWFYKQLSSQKRVCSVVSMGGVVKTLRRSNSHSRSVFSMAGPFVNSKPGRERKGPPKIIQKFRVRNWPISSADFPMTPMEGTEHHFGPFSEKDFGAISGGPFFSRPFVLLLTLGGKEERIRAWLM